MMQKEINMFLNEGNAAAAAVPSQYTMHHHNQDQTNEVNSGFFHPNWETSISMDQNDPFESALSSMVSSPTASASAAAANNGENIVLRELIGRLGSICNNNNNNNNSGEISPQPYNRSTTTSCYSTPLNSPPKLNLSSIMENNQFIMRRSSQIPGLPNLVADPGFAERAARFSCFANHQNLDSSSGKISRVPSNQCIKNSGSPENSSVSEQIPAGKEETGPNSRKRKTSSVPKAKGKDHTPPPAKDSNNGVGASENSESSSAKRSKSENDGNGNMVDDSKKAEGTNDDQKNNKDNNPKPPTTTAAEPPKDYIHVRARRGQATDAHSLAERVRREKISERMKVLQDLVPGCNKVTGKAVMLDEIINYVQSLQRQVEFLSMKLATVNPRMDFNPETLVSKDLFHRSQGSFPHNVYTSSDAYLFQSQPPNFGALPNGPEPTPFPPNHFSPRIQTMPLPTNDNFSEATSQVLTSWEDDLHSLVQMGYSQHQTQNFHGILPTAQMKVEL